VTGIGNNVDHRVARAAGLALVGALVAGCIPGEATGRRVIEQFVTAVQEQDLEALRCLLAGAARSDRDEFRAWARARYQDYLDGRDRGVVDLEGDGVVLVKAFALGRGTFYSITRTRYRGGGELRVWTGVRFGYGQANYGVFSPGTTFYLAGDPVGTIVAVRVPYEPGEITREVLDTVDVEWTLANVAEDGGCPGGWVVESVRPVPGTATTAVVTWPF